MLLLVRALELRLPHMTRGFWEDEIHHNLPPLTASTLLGIRDVPVWKWMFQPFLDFGLRKTIWFPLFGANELAMRLPSLIFSLLTIAVVFVFAAHFFAVQRKLDRRAAVLLAFLVAAWATHHLTSIHYAAEARHYSFVALASTLWCIVFFAYGGRPAWLFGCASLLFTNLHFFSLPLVAGGYALTFFAALRKKDWIAIGVGLLFCGAIYLSMRTINEPSLRMLLEGPPGTKTAEVRPSWPVITQAWSAGIDLWLEYARDLALPLPAWLLWLALGAAAFAVRDLLIARLLLVALVGLPMCFIYMRARSTYPFGPRYFSPFFGVGAATLLLSIAAASSLLARLTGDARKRAIPVAAAAALLLFGVPQLLFGAVADARQLRRLPKNFSPYHRAYELLKRENVPFFLLHNHCWATDIPLVYLDALGSRPRAPHLLASAVGCEAAPAWVRQSLAGFLQQPGALVVLDQKEDDCSQRPLTPTAPPGLVIERIPSVVQCFWKVRGARSVADVAAAARAVGFRTAPDLF